MRRGEIPALRSEYERKRATLGRTDPEVLDAASRLGEAVRRQHQPEAAGPLLSEVYEARCAVLGPDHWQTLMAGQAAALNMIDMKRFASAKDMEEVLLRQAETKYPTWDAFRLSALWGLSRAEQGLGQRTEDLAAIQREIVSLEERLHGRRHEHLYAALWDLSRTHRALGDQQEARDLVRQAIWLAPGIILSLLWRRVSRLLRSSSR